MVTDDRTGMGLNVSVFGATGAASTFDAFVLS
jgi:hypothetical protein